ncbi:MAG: TIR domain-containing protein [Phycisphaerales bacterium]
MITVAEFKELAHRSGRSKRDLVLAALACPDREPKLLERIRELYEAAGVKRPERKGISATLRDATGLARKTPVGYELTEAAVPRVSGMFNAVSRNVSADAQASLNGRVVVFVGHGRSAAWQEVERFLEKRLRCEVEEFNHSPTAGRSNKERLLEMLSRSKLAILVHTAEDEQRDSKKRARQNVVHETGLFQGRLGFERAIVLLERGCEKFSNMEGISHIGFENGHIGESF